MALTSQNPETTRLIEETVNKLDSGIDSTTQTDGVALIDRWIDALDENGDDQTDSIADTLEDLKAELDPKQQSGSPDPAVLRDLLQDLIDQTKAVMNSAEASAEQTELSQLVATLTSIHQQLP